MTGCLRSNTTDSARWRFEMADRRGSIRATAMTSSARHPHIIERLNRLPVCRFVLDGELVVLDEDGRSNFARLAHGRQRTHYYAFDLLLFERDDLRQCPLEDRKAAVEKLVSGCDPVRYTDYVIGTGRGFFDAVKDAGLEGMVAKRRRSLYAGRLTNDWLKIKCLRVHDFVIGGWIPDGREPFRELLLGAYIDGKLRYVGRVGAGFNSRVTRAIARMLEPVSDSAFADQLPEPQARFCAPTLRISVEFLDLTDDGYLRHATFRRFAVVNASRSV